MLFVYISQSKLFFDDLQPIFQEYNEWQNTIHVRINKVFISQNSYINQHFFFHENNRKQEINNF